MFLIVLEFQVQWRKILIGIERPECKKIASRPDVLNNFGNYYNYYFEDDKDIFYLQYQTKIENNKEIPTTKLNVSCFYMRQVGNKDDPKKPYEDKFNFDRGYIVSTIISH